MNGIDAARAWLTPERLTKHFGQRWHPDDDELVSLIAEALGPCSANRACEEAFAERGRRLCAALDRVEELESRVKKLEVEKRELMSLEAYISALPYE